MRTLAHIAISGLLFSQAAVADEQTPVEATEPVSIEGAADLAAELKDQAYSVNLDTASESDETMQAYVDQIGTVATLLESELRAGKQRGDTELLYRELRRLRLEAIGLAMRGDAALPEGAEEFEALLAELGRYQRAVE